MGRDEWLTRPGTGEGRYGVGRAAAVAAALALVVGLGYAAVSAYWAAGGRALLATVGGVFLRAAEAGGALVLAGAWAVVVVKVIAAALPAAALWSRRWTGHIRRLITAAAGAGAVILTLYGLVLTTAGLLVQGGVIRAGAGADHRALAWHAYLWDPWFLVWGVLAAAALLLGHGRVKSGGRVRGDCDVVR